MRTGQISTCVGVVVCAGLLMAAQPARADSSEVTLSGCLVKAADEAGYLVTNSPAEFAGKRNGAGKVSLNAFGATGGFAPVIYWIENKDALTPHIGHFVEVEGELKGDPMDGELKVDRKDRWTELEVKAAGRTLHANVPNTSVMPGPDGKKDSKSTVTVRRVSVEKVKMLGAGCAP